ncbi:hypothetical protein BDA96_01G247200 [Sorghum bicolor]|uniref:Uncharacterized protein n=1 Tax=Sorghum bicolor TaxID=4558 RepID=A0A921UY76_SORBI|nr:hypothetical protein BDA96_01G237500 [Sorghum bicolor]KAG0549340.1 hypothetical protein BDA96_01G247200 [Sorghum bicolor]
MYWQAVDKRLGLQHCDRVFKVPHIYDLVCMIRYRESFVSVITLWCYSIL